MQLRIPSTGLGAHRPQTLTPVAGSRSSFRHKHHHRHSLKSIVTNVAAPPSSTENGNKASAEVEVPSTLPSSALEVDTVFEKELHEYGVRSIRRTKFMATIGPACASLERLEALALNGMGIARLNMCHATHEWHEGVIQRIRQLNNEKGFSISIMLDTEGSEVHTLELADPIKAETDQDVIFTVRKVTGRSVEGLPYIGVSYDSFIDDVEVGDMVVVDSTLGDMIVVDGGMVVLEVTKKQGPDVRARCVEPGLILSKANLTFRRDGAIIRGRNAMLPVISAKDWQDIEFAISQGVDFIGVSFVKGPDVIQNLRTYLQMRSRDKPIELVAKIESYDSIVNLDQIIMASDAVMVARGDLGAQVPLEDVPNIQKYVVLKARQLGKPSIVAAQLLQSMIEHPVPTRAEVADVADAIRQRSDCLMLGAETAMGKYPEKVLQVLRAVAIRTESWIRSEPSSSALAGLALATHPAAPPALGYKGASAVEELCSAAATIANNIQASAIFLYTRRGRTATLVSRFRPNCPIYAFTDRAELRQRLNLRWGTTPFRVDFTEDYEANVQRTMELVKARGLLMPGDMVVVLSDHSVQEDGEPVRSIQLRTIT